MKKRKFFVLMLKNMFLKSILCRNKNKMSEITYKHLTYKKTKKRISKTPET